MGFNYKQLRQDYIKTPNLRNSYGISVNQLPDGELAYRVIGIYHLAQNENVGGHNAFVDILDENGNVIKNLTLRILTNNHPRGYFQTDKSGDEPSGNTPIWGNDNLSISVVDNLPSESVVGLRTNHPDEPTGNTLGHHSFYVVWQKRKSIVETPPIEPPPPTDDNELERIEQEIKKAIAEEKKDMDNYAKSKRYGDAQFSKGKISGLEEALNIVRDI